MLAGSQGYRKPSWRLPSPDVGRRCDDYSGFYRWRFVLDAPSRIVNDRLPRFLDTAFPYHTFIINMPGSTVMGLTRATSRQG